MMEFVTAVNRFVAGAVSTANAVTAVLLPLVFALVGSQAGGFLGFIGGLVIGVMTAFVLCGLLALVIDIRNGLRDKSP